MEIINIICKIRNVSVSDVMSDSRQGKVPYTRFMIWFYMHYTMDFSANQIAKKFQRRRTTIFRGLRVLKHIMRHDQNIRDEYHDILQKLEGMTEVTPSENMD